MDSRNRPSLSNLPAWWEARGGTRGLSSHRREAHAYKKRLGRDPQGARGTRRKDIFVFIHLRGITWVHARGRCRVALLGN